MTTTSRRHFLKTLGAGGLVLLSGIPARSWGANANVVIIGGGTGGATAAKYLKLADPSINVTLIEKNAYYYTCYMSNEVLSGGRSLDSLKFGYEGLQKRGINVVQAEVTAIDAAGKLVKTSAGDFPYDRCIVAPGIDYRYETVEGYRADIAEQIPHAWKAGEQTSLLRSQLEAMPDGGTFVMVAPPNPYRCPPAPYERASQVASYFKKHKPRSKVLILDPKTSFTKQALFEEGWMKLYGYGSSNAMIEWVSGSNHTVVRLDAANRAVTTVGGQTISAGVLNLIPAQKAGALAFAAGLTDASGWCPVALSSFESTLRENIHVIGDACIASPLPKSGFAANSEAKACALAVAALLNGREPGRTSFANGCYSLVGDDYAISIVGIYRLSADGLTIETVPNSGGMSPLAAAEEERLIDVQYAYSWYNNFTRDVFF
ncbi:MAG TPA: NAD(P)/FAD-dependent oxidoreductase [Candidatus Thiothrix moscowensis]|uniref:NAD(P)/FAD-dependent oxidoreductase n=1 Tax=unclassified Thiothrix TaxID=2636184 RepID=UPI0025F6C34A|nr:MULTISPECIES: NAD(P)/FAD-dependent oxidoreductase [unclassified Thiothrix]HRJ53017.1 NAD(P)/FAD-dependent oxidoreductase [Candidatus Thiothrix moscowensis]HRJ92939.1 NAD(P)/FAD-dependent oxidoreductase [Candidatus Thiothrix moscowensis]